MMFVSVNLSVICENPAQVATVMEAIGRVGTGIALDGLTVNVNLVTVDEDGD